MLIKNISVFSYTLVASLAMTGCANSDVLEQKMATLTNKVDSLSIKVATLSTDVTKVKAQQKQSAEMIADVKASSEQAAMDAQNATKRIDNLVKSYKK